MAEQKDTMNLVDLLFQFIGIRSSRYYTFI